MSVGWKRVKSEDLASPSHDVVNESIAVPATEIVDDVRRRGEAALREYAERLDDLAPTAPYRFDREALDRALAARPREERELLRRTHDRIRTFAQAQRECLRDLETTVEGARMGHDVRPVPVAGCYAPGGRFPLPSSVLMTAATARVAGVPEVIVVSPRATPTTMAAAAVAGADALFTLGGAHAISAMAYGVGSVPRCDVIVGPGNAWVTAAKQRVAGIVRIDSLAGPSELVVVADDDSDSELVAADLLAQAEHDPLAVPGLVAFSTTTRDAIEAAIERQLEDLPTQATARPALENGFAVVVDSAEEAIAICNRLAPEHLQWMVEGPDPRELGLRHYGGLFLGSGAAEVLGDYGAGPNHVLPTGGSGRARGGLSVLDFLKVNTWLAVDAPAARERLAGDAESLAELEGLAGHARAARRRKS